MTNPFGVTYALPVDLTELRRWNAEVRAAGDAYELRKADHALPYGCELCARGTAVQTPSGWLGVGPLLVCPQCMNLNSSGVERVLEAIDAGSWVPA